MPRRHSFQAALLCLLAVGCKSPAAPIVIPTGTLTFASIVTRIDHACALTPSGAAYCWGLNTNGMVGDGTTLERDLPTAVAGGLTFTSLATGRSTTCGLVAGGSAYCWGLNGAGQFGDGTTTSQLVPAPAGSGHKFASIAFSDGTSAPPYEVCGLEIGGAVFCWARGTTTPVAAATGFSFTLLSVGLGGNFCGLVAIGDAYCWGFNPAGELGTGPNTVSATFNPTPARVVGGHSFASISSGFLHACGVVTDLQLYCWGDDTYGELGDSTFNTASPVPVLVKGGRLYSTVSADYDGTCAVTTSGAGYCWGHAVRGNLGVGSGPATFITIPRAMTGGLQFAAISLGGGGNGCGVTPAHVAYCWGQGGSILGIGPDGSRVGVATAPMKVGLQP